MPPTVEAESHLSPPNAVRERSAEQTCSDNIHYFGPERGRDIFLVVERVRFHVHSAIVRLTLSGKVFDSLVEQAYEDELHREVKLVDDDEEAWKCLLKWIYTLAECGECAWDVNEALNVVPLVHKYEGVRALQSLNSALAANTDQARQLRTPRAAELLVAHHMETVTESWFSDVTWTSCETIAKFLRHDDSGNIYDGIRRQALSCCLFQLRHTNLHSDDVALLREAIEDHLPVLASSCRDLVELFMRHGKVRQFRSPRLAQKLCDAGLNNVVESWFQDSEWRLGVEHINNFFESKLECLYGGLIGKIADNMRGLPEDQAVERLRLVFMHCALPTYREQVENLVDRTGSYCKGPGVVNLIASHGFLDIALRWIEAMVDSRTLRAMMADCCHERVLRAAHAKLLSLVEAKHSREQASLKEELAAALELVEHLRSSKGTCDYWRTKGNCKHGDRCLFSHESSTYHSYNPSQVDNGKGKGKPKGFNAGFNLEGYRF